MGKINRNKTSRVHQKSSYIRNRDELVSAKTAFACNEEQKKENADEKQFSSMPEISLESNPFSGLSIDIEKVITQNLPNEAAIDKNIVTEEKKVKQKTSLKKKDKMKHRKEEFLKKLSASYAAEAQRKKKKARSQVPVVGDMIQLKEALPKFSKKLTETDATDINKNVVPKATVKSSNDKKSSISKSKQPISKPKKMKQRKKRQLELLEIQKFQDLVKSGGTKTINLQVLNS